MSALVSESSQEGPRLQKGKQAVNGLPQPFLSSHQGKLRNTLCAENQLTGRILIHAWMEGALDACLDMWDVGWGGDIVPSWDYGPFRCLQEAQSHPTNVQASKWRNSLT